MLRADTKFVAHFILASSDRLEGGVWVISLVRVSGVVGVGTDLGTSVCCWVGVVVVVVVVLPLVSVVGGSLGDSVGFFLV